MDRNYIYHESTVSICSTCFKKISAKIIIKNDQVYLQKFCNEHGEFEELLEQDAKYYLKRREYDKPGTISKTQTKIDKGCPFDCGLCPDHDQHSCISLIEVTNACDLKCPICYAKSGENTFLDIQTFSKMLDFLIDSEGGETEILQISGGEPTTHPNLIELIECVRSKNINYLMLNTNGIRIANDEEFVKQLSKFKGKFEIYLQFDGFSTKTSNHLRGKDLTQIKLKAIQNLTKYEIPITLVSTIEKDLNENEIGKIIDFGMKTKGIRGVNFQPVAFFGRIKHKNVKNRITLTGIINKIQEQTNGLFIEGDIIPLPCNVERVGVTYLAKSRDNKFIPVTRNINIKSYLPLIDNTFAFDADRILKEKSKQTEKISCNCLNFISDLKEIIPLSFALKSKEEKLKYVNENTFRLSITSFIDVYNFDMKSMQKECVHIITPNFKKIPFSAYNMFYRP